MKTKLDCFPCFVRQALDATRMATQDERIHRKVLSSIFSILSNISIQASPPEIAHLVHLRVKSITGNFDPYKAVKKKQNTVHHAKAITGIQRVHAVLGGFHLTGAPLPKVQRTIQELKALSPKYLCPMHCTGFDTMVKFKEAFQEEYIISSVGTQITFA